jgi:AcrR family transcriptional regulator
MAGLSRGAHLHHFGTRAALLAAALAALAERREDEFRRQVKSLPVGPHRVCDALDLVWGWFNGPLFHAAVDLAVAARTDDDLRASLAPVERDLDATTLRRCREMFTGDRADGSRDGLIRFTLATVRGLALLPVLQPGSRRATKQWAFARAELLTLFSENGS